VGGGRAGGADLLEGGRRAPWAARAVGASSRPLKPPKMTQAAPKPHLAQASRPPRPRAPPPGNATSPLQNSESVGRTVGAAAAAALPPAAPPPPM
jgi:hypothetical protein